MTAIWLFLKAVNWQIYAAIALAGALTFSHDWAYRKGEASTQVEWDAQKAKDAVAQRAADEAAALQANKASLRYQDWKIAQQPRVVTVTKEITHAIEIAPAWSAEPLPDGVRSAIAAASAALAASGPDSTVPVPDPGRAEQRAVGPGLHPSLAGFGRLFGAASQPR